ncbi:MAG TPA: transporter [Woeseiaceae bacterium]|jgi:hypothetical protein|nr:transporter [Woeseiaceae bacterium]
MVTDDPDTPGPGHWEINLGYSTERRPGTKNWLAPLLDINYGVGERLQLKYEVPYLRETADGSPDESGFGNSEVGLKWRFLDSGDNGLSVSVYPQLEFNNPGSSADDRGLVEHGAAFLLPFQFEKEAGQYTVTWQLGREFRSAGDSWFYGVSAGRHVRERVEVGVELAGEANSDFGRSNVVANIGLVVDLGERSSIMFSAGSELQNHDEARATVVGYLGVQWRL